MKTVTNHLSTIYKLLFLLFTLSAALPLSGQHVSKADIA